MERERRSIKRVVKETGKIMFGVLGDETRDIGGEVIMRIKEGKS